MVRNASNAGHSSVVIPASKNSKSVLQVLQQEGYIAGIEEVAVNEKPAFKIILKYEDGRPVIKELKRISTPGRRQYVGCEDIPTNKGGLGVVIVSTSKGMLSDGEARRQKVGGELICSVF